VKADQAILFGLLGVVFVLLIWGRWRYDLVAFLALTMALLTGVVPPDQAFVGFGHPATVIVAMVLIVSRALCNAGVVELVARHFLNGTQRLAAHIGTMAGLAAALSAFMNNVAALALLMPVDLEAAAKGKRSPALTLMPLSFATILGGMITLIGTPPNIVIAAFRKDAVGESFGMFDFTPVGLACAVVGVLFVATLGWRWIPAPRREHNTAKELFDLEGYVAELKVPEGSAVVGKRVRELDDAAEEQGCEIVGVIRRGHRLPGLARGVELAKGDVLVLQAKPEGIDKLVGALGLEYTRADRGRGPLTGEDLSLLEVVVPPGARIAGRSALSLRLLYDHGVTLLGVSRQGVRFTERVRKLEIQPGDVLLLLGPREQLPDTASWLGGLPLAERGLQVLQRRKAGLALAVFGTAVVLASLGLLKLTVALASAVGVLVAANVVPIRQVYESIEWSVIVLLGSMIPLGMALEQTGGTALIAHQLVAAASGLPPSVVLLALVVVTMTLSDVLNNTATAVIAAPIAVDIARQLKVSPDPFLMGVAVAASCAFLTPIGHKNNTLILGPGGYRFGDYWRMGLPLEILIVLVSIPMILWVWPLTPPGQ